MPDDNSYSNGAGVMRAMKAFNCSRQGLRAAFKYESAFRQELGLACFFVPYGLWLGDGVTQKMFLMLLVVLVLVAELLNSAVEAVVDRVGLEHHDLSGRAKDFGSAAVMCCLLFTGICYAVLTYLRFAG